MARVPEGIILAKHQDLVPRIPETETSVEIDLSFASFSRNRRPSHPCVNLETTVKPHEAVESPAPRW